MSADQDEKNQMTVIRRIMSTFFHHDDLVDWMARWTWNSKPERELRRKELLEDFVKFRPDQRMKIESVICRKEGHDFSKNGICHYCFLPESFSLLVPMEKSNALQD